MKTTVDTGYILYLPLAWPWFQQGLEVPPYNSYTHLLFCSPFSSLKCYLPPISVHPPPTQIVCTLAGLLLFSYFHLNLIELILYGVTFNIALLIKYTSKNSSYIAIKSSCYSSETQHLLKFANRDKSLTEVLQSVRKLEDKINFSNKQVKKIDVFLIAIPRMGFNCF